MGIDVVKSDPELALALDWTKQPPALAALRRIELHHDRRIAIAKTAVSAFLVATCVTLAVWTLVAGFRPGGGLLLIAAAWGLRSLVPNVRVVRRMSHELAALERAALPEARVLIRE